MNRKGGGGLQREPYAIFPPLPQAQKTEKQKNRRFYRHFLFFNKKKQKNKRFYKVFVVWKRKNLIKPFVFLFFWLKNRKCL